MMTPIQRVTRYQLLMKEIEKSYSQLATISAQLAEKIKEEAEKPSEDEDPQTQGGNLEEAEAFAKEMSETHTEIKLAYEITHEIAEYANDMMVAGRINGFSVS